VTTHTKRYVRCFWALDPARAQARFYPSVHPLQSYSQDLEVLREFWTQHGNPQWTEQRRRFLGLLEEQARLERMARIVGKDALPPRQQQVLLCAELINEAFLRQSAFSTIDRFCSPERQIAMMQTLVRFIDLSEAALAQQVDMAELATLPLLRRLRRMGEDIGDEQLDRFDALRRDMEAEFIRLAKRGVDDAG
jgi:V/A-type H+-transporting ATPase subunit A